jgi:hypothetical protein
LPDNREALDFLGIEIRPPGMKEMNGRKILQEQAHGRGKK